MPKLTQNAVAMLEFISDAEQEGRNSVRLGEMRESLDIPDGEFDHADRYLVRTNLMKGTKGGEQGQRWLTPHGMVVLEEARATGTFWKRKKDDIILAVISGGIGLIVGIISTLLFSSSLFG